MPRKETVLIANGQGFWGDSILGPVRLVNEGPLDYLTLDYLAEVTMSIMQKLKSRKPDAGYATDFVAMIDRVLPQLVAKGVKVIANAGGVNPQACKDAVLAVIKKHGFAGKGIKVAVVEGDDILHNLDDLIAQGETFKNMDTGAPLSTVRDRVSSANVYIGAFPIAEALDKGAQIVITGRATDPSLVLGPMIHEFGWTRDDYDKLAAGTVAGHILECGAQCTGGNYTDWQRIPDMARIGYPIAEARADGTFVVTKHDGTGGLVDISTVTHQLAYEMGDPQRYLTPDCVADFTSFTLEQDGPNRVKVSGVKGGPATPSYKVSMSYHDGFKAQGQLTISGPDALAKAKLCAQIVFDRLKLDGCEYSNDEKLIEYVGANVCHAGIETRSAGGSPAHGTAGVPPASGPGGAGDSPARRDAQTSPLPVDPPEIVLRIGVKGPDREKVDRFGPELIPLVTSGPPGVTGFAGGRPKATDIIGFWPALMAKDRVTTTVSVFEA